ncbi:MAG: membrane protein insertion efficiency factor YidD [bacterium]
MYPFFLRAYQYLISPFFPPSCRFYPSCSQYAVESIQKYGLWIGLGKSVSRVLRCNPWNKGGYDPVFRD